jgi:hypothetical protein
VITAPNLGEKFGSVQRVRLRAPFHQQQTSNPLRTTSHYHSRGNAQVSSSAAAALESSSSSSIERHFPRACTRAFPASAPTQWIRQGGFRTTLKLQQASPKSRTAPSPRYTAAQCTSAAACFSTVTRVYRPMRHLLTNLFNDMLNNSVPAASACSLPY